jgi:hypothetical protein
LFGVVCNHSRQANIYLLHVIPNWLKPKNLKHAEAIIEENKELIVTEWKKTFGE